MENKHYKILTINPGSTSTKIGVFDDDKCVFKTTIDHSLEELAPFKEISDQKEFRLNVITKVLKDNNIQNVNKLVTSFYSDLEYNDIIKTEGKRKYFVVDYEKANEIITNLDDTVDILNKLKS